MRRSSDYRIAWAKLIGCAERTADPDCPESMALTALRVIAQPFGDIAPVLLADTAESLRSKAARGMCNVARISLAAQRAQKVADEIAGHPVVAPPRERNVTADPAVFKGGPAPG